MKDEGAIQQLRKLLECVHADTELEQQQTLWRAGFDSQHQTESVDPYDRLEWEHEAYRHF